MDFFEKVLTQYGFGVTMAVFVAFLLWNILNWTKSQIEKTITSAERREEESRKLWEAHRIALEAHTECSKEFHREVSSAHQFQREEHGQQIKALEKIISRIEALPSHPIREGI
jgi:F0F1-type ATP synthase membrane subunit b/b'